VAQAGIAGTPETSLLAAYGAQPLLEVEEGCDFMAALPIETPTSWKENETSASKIRAREEAAELRRVIAILHQWGIHTLGQFSSLPKAEVACRLGLEAVAMWERASGRATRLLQLVPPPESFAESYEFEHEIETAEPLLFMLRRFLEQLTQRLQALYFVTKELKLRVIFADKTAYEHLFKIPEPCNNVEVLFRMLQTHLENFTSASPIVAVALEAQPGRAGQQQFNLFETALRDPTQLSETLARLTGLLGSERVGTPVIAETHRPDAFRMEPFSWELPETESLAPLSAPALRRFRGGMRAAVLREEGKPVHLRSAALQGAAVAQNGPYVSSGNWWDGNAWSRAEWDLALATGAVCRCHEEAGTWQVDGIYD